MVNALVYGAILIGIAAAAYVVARSPVFWVGLAETLIKAALPLIVKRMSPEDEKTLNEMQINGSSQDEINRWQWERLKRASGHQ